MANLLRWVRRAVRVAGWAPVGFFLLHVLLLVGTGAYENLLYVDSSMHLLGGAVIAWFFLRAAGLAEAVPVMGQLSATGRTLFAWTALGTAVVAWEGLEWAPDVVAATSIQEDVTDTMIGMASGIIGGTALLLIHATARAS